MSEERRRHYRCPLQVPMKFQVGTNPKAILTETGSLSEGGLHFYSTVELHPGTSMTVTLPVQGRLFHLTGEVVSCRRDRLSGKFRVSVAFHDSMSQFRIKLAEEILRIRQFREETSRGRGRDVSEEEAAKLWINRYAAKFSELFG